MLTGPGQVNLASSRTCACFSNFLGNNFDTSSRKRKPFHPLRVTIGGSDNSCDKQLVA